jgi:hypothetical protein
MRARVAYISSFGTTAILVAAALLMLAVVGAIVAFRGWPGSASAAGVQSVPLGPSLRPVRATPVVTRVNRAVVRTRPAAAVTRRLSTVGLVKQVAPRVVPGLVMVPTGRGPSVHPASPQPGRPGPTFPAPSGRDPAIGSLPAAPSRSAPVDPAQLVPIQLPSSGGPPPPPSADEVSSAVSQLVAQAPPPPSLHP